MSITTKCSSTPYIVMQCAPTNRVISEFGLFNKYATYAGMSLTRLRSSFLGVDLAMQRWSAEKNMKAPERPSEKVSLQVASKDRAYSSGVMLHMSRTLANRPGQREEQ